MWFQSPRWCGFSLAGARSRKKGEVKALLDESRFRILSHMLERINFGGGRKDDEGLNNESNTLELIEEELNIGRENKELRVC